MQDVLDLVRFPIDRPDSAAGEALVARCGDDLARFGMFDMDGFVRPAALRCAREEVNPLLDSAGAVERRRHNVYEDPAPSGVPPGHPALAEGETANRAVHSDRLEQSLLHRLYDPPLRAFLARVLKSPRLCPVADPRQRLVVIRYEAGQALSWHFGRCGVAVILVLQAPEYGGTFEHVRDLRSDTDPNYNGVAALLAGRRPVEIARPIPGTLNVFRGRNTAHRVTAVAGDRPRIVAILSFDDRPA